MCYLIFCCNYFRTQALYYYVFLKNWAYRKKGKKDKQWENKDEYEAMLNRLGEMTKASKEAKAKEKAEGVKKVKRSKGKKRRERGIALGFTRDTQKFAWIYLFLLEEG